MKINTDVEAPMNSGKSHTHTVNIAVQSLHEFILHGAVEVPPAPESGLSSPYAAHFVLPTNAIPVLPTNDIIL